MIDPLSRSYFVEAKLVADKLLHPNQLAQVKIKDYEKKNAISIPINTVQTDDKGKFVFIAFNENGKWLRVDDSFNASLTNIIPEKVYSLTTLNKNIHINNSIFKDYSESDNRYINMNINKIILDIVSLFFQSCFRLFKQKKT